MPIEHIAFLRETKLFDKYVTSDILKWAVENWAEKVGCTRQNYKQFFKQLELFMWRITYPQSEFSLIDDEDVSRVVRGNLGSLRPKFDELVGKGTFKSAQDMVGAMKSFVLFLIGLGLLDQVL